MNYTNLTWEELLQKANNWFDLPRVVKEGLSRLKALISTTDSRPYKIYAALLTQVGTGSPVAVILENTLGANITWTRADIGRYIGTLSTEIDVQKSGILSANNSENALYTTFINTTTEIEVQTSNLNTGVPELIDEYLIETLIELKVYN